MPKIAYINKTFTGDKKAIVANAERIVTTYQSQGYRLTLRQLYYRFVADDLFPASWADPESGTKNLQKNYKKLGDILAEARMAGKIDWEAIEDRTRELSSVSHWSDPADIINASYHSFRLDKWADQPTRIEVWVEKDALEGIVSQAAHAMDVAAFSCRGYTSLSAIWEASQRLKGYVKAGQRPVILHLGDHDPSGIDMTRDIGDRLNDFLIKDWLREELKRPEAKRSEIEDSILERCGAKGITIHRIALNMDQVEQYDPPPNPAKTTDSRFRGYQEEHGDESWELDALEPAVLDTLIRNHIEAERDGERFAAAEAIEAEHRKDLRSAAIRWNDVSAYLRNGRK